MSATEEMIEKMYESQLKSQKEQMDTGYKQAILDLDAQQRKNQQATDANLNRTAVEAQKAAVGNAELHNAYGLSSGTRAQARLAQENQLQADMTALRAAQQNADADVERQRSLLAQEYASAIRQAQAENDLAKAEALYASAKEEENKLLAKQEAAGKLMAEVAGDYTLLGKLYGLSEKELAALPGYTGKTEGTPQINGISGMKEALEASLVEKLTAAIKDTVSAVRPALPSEAPAVPVVPTTPQSIVDAATGGRFDVLEEIVQQAMGPTEEEKLAADPGRYADLPTDEESVKSLGFGALTPQQLEDLIAAGVVEEYVEDGYIKYRRKQIAHPGAALNPWWK